VDGNTFHYGPDESGAKNLIFSLENLVRWPRLATVQMVKGGNDSSGPRLPDVIERDGIVRSKPPPSLLHVQILSAAKDFRPGTAKVTTID
jgi:hypothetical protein